MTKTVTFPDYLGSYRVTQTMFNSGSYGKIALGYHLSGGESVCVKGVPDDVWDDAERVSLSCLKHPNVLSLKGYYHNNRTHYLVTDFAEGGDLFDYLDGKDRLPEAECRHFMFQLAGALQYIHSCGIVHRDLKLENLFLDRSKKNLLVGDWGFSCFWSSQSKLEESCGTLYYMSPELVARRHYRGPEVDAWAFGVVLYYLSVGHLPFDADDSSTTERLILECRPYLPAYLSRECRDLLSRLLCPASRRISISQALQHPWLQAGAPKRKPNAPEMMLLLSQPPATSPSQSRFATRPYAKRKSDHPPGRYLDQGNAANKRQRRIYRCGRCGMPKRGHTCAPVLNASSSSLFHPGAFAASSSSNVFLVR